VNKSFNGVTIVIEDKAGEACRLEQLLVAASLNKGGRLHGCIEPVTKDIRKSLDSQLQGALSGNENGAFDRTIFLACNKRTESSTRCIADRAKYCLVIHADVVGVHET
jgi:hypothetical protein